VVDAAWTAELRGHARFISAQDEYSLLFRKPEPELIPALRAKGMGLLPFFPLASGLLSGKYSRGAMPPGDTRFGKDARTRDRYMTETNWTRVEKLDAFARSHGHSLLELAFSWLACRDVVGSVIAGATRPEQIAANVTAARWKLTAEEMAEVDKLTA
jgi:aryl-alcohol dehydrogenase-like predicted oxidoreductase